MLDELVLQARRMGASDLHLTPASVPMVRIDGGLQPLTSAVISREKLEAALLALLPEQEKRQLLQNGEVDTAFSDSTQKRCRLNVYRLGNGYAAWACRKLSASLRAASAVCCLSPVLPAAAKAQRLLRWYSR